MFVFQSVKPLTHFSFLSQKVEKVTSAIMTLCFGCTLLVLAQRELILVTMVLFFGFVTKAVLITQGYFTYCSTVLLQHKGFYLSYAGLPTSRLGVHKTAGGDTARPADPKCSKGYSSNKSWERRRK